jgi:hypothetical protein
MARATLPESQLSGFESDPCLRGTMGHAGRFIG